jgi:hypothetical protein
MYVEVNFYVERSLGMIFVARVLQKWSEVIDEKLKRMDGVLCKGLISSKTCILFFLYLSHTQHILYFPCLPNMYRRTNNFAIRVNYNIYAV